MLATATPTKCPRCLTLNPFESVDKNGVARHSACGTPLVNLDQAVYATLADGKVVRVSDPLDWNAAVAEWGTRDAARLAGLHPDVRYFEVRSTDDPKYADAPLSLGHSLPLLKSRGFKHETDAARAAWRLWQGETTRLGQAQGEGGWFYWHSGRPVCQGLDDLAAVCRSRALVVKGVDGRYYPAVTRD